MRTIEQRPTQPSPPSGWRGAVMAWFDLGEPHEHRGPFARWPRTTDAVLAILVAAASLVTVALSALDDGESFTLGAIGDIPVGGIVLLTVAAGALLFRRRYAMAVAAVAGAVMVVWAVAGYGDGQDVALAVAAYSIGRYTDDHRHSIAAVIAIAAISGLGTLIDENQRVDVAPAFVVTALPWYVGRRVRNRHDYLGLLRERAERLEADRAAAARQAVADERSRIARELHDVVAHRVSMMTVQAGAAKTVARDDVDAAVEAMGDVEQAGRQALGELRHLLGVLRTSTEAPDHLGPQPGIADIPTLVDQLASTGATTTLTIGDLPDDLSAAIDLSAYRIVQESLTNVVKHAGPNPTVEVAVTTDGRTLVIDIANSTTIAPSELPTSGFGIAGMRERVTLLGGTIDAGHRHLGGYRVCVRLPLRPEAA